MTAADKKAKEVRIGYLPLAHGSYWRFFPEHEKTALKWAKHYGEYLSQFGTLCETGQLIDLPSRSQEARRLFQAADVDVLILTTVTYSTPDDIVLDLKRFPRPIVVWNTQPSSTLPDDLDFNKWMMEHGVTGVPGITNLLERENMPYFLISGHYTSEKVKASFASIFEALRAQKAIWGSRIGIFGHLYPGMIDFGYDPALLYTTFGAGTVCVHDSSVLTAFKDVGADETKALENTLRCKYSLHDDFKGEEFSRSARLALAMKRIAKEEALSAATVYCQSMWQQPEIGVVPCLGNSLLMQEGIFCSCEGDVPTALSGMIMNSFSSGQGVFTEIWANDFDNDCFMMGHSGSMNLALFERTPASVRLSRHPWWDGCHGRGACLELQMPAGEVTFLGICCTRDGHWRMVVTICNVMERPSVPLGAPNFFLKLRRPIAEFLDDFGATGAAHHLAMAYGDWTGQLKALARILKVEYRRI